jgi:ribosome modulation factor
MIFKKKKDIKKALKRTEKIGYKAGFNGNNLFDNPYKLDLDLRKIWKKGFLAGSKDRFENLPVEEKEIYWERQWRQSEFEKYKITRALSPFAFLFSQKNNVDLESLVFDDGDGNRIYVKDCINALNIINKYQCADIEEISEDIERTFKNAIKYYSQL